MQIFKETHFDFLGKRWWAIGLSVLLMVASAISLYVKGGPRYGIDFNGGALMYVKFVNQPHPDMIRSALSAKISGEITVQNLAGSDEMLIGTEIKDEQQLNASRAKMEEVLRSKFGESSGKLDLNNSGQEALANRLRDPLQRASVALSEQQLQDLTKAILGYRDSAPRSGLLRNVDELGSVPGVTPVVMTALKQECYTSGFAIRNIEMVGPKVGADLRRQAIMATLYALGGMLIYIAFRFEWIYGLGAVIAVFHDTVVTVGLFSIFNKEISLTVVAAILTLVGYSMNDTIVIFDRIRENLKVMRKEKLEPLMNISVNQTLSRTVLTSGLTFLTCIALYLFGGPVLHGFSFALVVGIIVGTYSSVFIASPIVLFWNNFLESRKKVAVAASAGKTRKG
ncbi:MAG: protein translocase subunit SecF [Acidobacteriales bacterium]|nr:protein translocase subunit SecF [Terriglobales bacterium]